MNVVEPSLRGSIENEVTYLGNPPYTVTDYQPFKRKAPKPIAHVGAPDFLYWVMLTVVIIWTWLRVTGSKRLNQLSESFISNRFTDQWIREEGLLRSDVNVWLLFASSIVLAVVLWELPWFVQVFGIAEEQPFIQFLWLFLGTVVFLMVRISSVFISNFLISSTDFATTYLFNIFLFIQALSILLFPLVLVYTFGEVISTSMFISIVIGLVGLAFLIRIGKLLYLGITQSNFSVVYIILYLCSLEILPLSVVYANLY